MPRLGRFTRELRARLWQPSVDEEVRSELGERVGEWWQDVRYALRQLRANRRFATVAILTLAIGLGASTTIFGIANVLLLRPLPFHEPSRLVLVDEVNPSGQPFAVSEPDYLDFRARARRLAALAAFSPRLPSLLGDGAPERLRGVAATHTLFGVLGVAPQLGRVLAADEDRRGGDVRVAILSDGLWRRRFGADPRVLERVVDLDGVRHRVIGVMPPGFDFPGATDIWVPLAPDLAYERGDRRLEVVGRLANGATLEQSSQELLTIANQLAAEHPRSNGAWKAQARPFAEWYVSPALRSRVTALLAAVGLLVLMACVNVASLLLARAGVREREMAVRAALGAGRGRIVRQLLTESVVLALLGAALGVTLAAVATPLIRRIGSTAVPLLSTMSLDWRVLGFALVACLATGIIFGLAPAVRLSRAGGGASGAHDLLRSGARIAGGGHLRGALTISSVALAMLMLVSAGLVGGSFVRLMRTDLGFAPERVLTASIVLPEDQYDYGRSADFFQQLMPRVARIAGVRAAGAVNLAPFSGGNTGMDFMPGPTTPASPADYRNAAWRAITPGYFAALGIPLQRGRAFDETDTPSAPSAIIINETMARVGWPGVDPIGRQVTLANGRTFTIVGVVGDTRALAIDSAPVSAMYFAHAQFPWKAMWLTVRTTGDPMSVTAAVRREVRAIDPDLPLARVGPLTGLVRDSAAEPRLTMLVFGIFAGAALVLAAVGLYGLVAYTVAQRTREIGVRLALGAPPRRVVGGVLGQGMKLALAGIVLGSVAALGATGFLRAILYETAPTDVTTYALVALLLLAVASVASAIPARRASRLDPVASLRSD